MATKYDQRIRDYCARHSVTVPFGFARHAPSRYAIIQTAYVPPKLIAKTWFKTEDVVYYIEHFLSPEFGDAVSESIRILDFKTGDELAYVGGTRLRRVATFEMGGDARA